MHSHESTGSGKFALNENGLARFGLSEAISVDGCGDTDVRNFQHSDGDRVSECDEMDHR